MLKSINIILFLSFFLATFSSAQITSPNANSKGFNLDAGVDFYVFCVANEGDAFGKGSLLAESSLGNAVFTWEKYDTISGNFNVINTEYPIISDTLKSSVSRLDNGLYRVTISSDDGNVMEAEACILHNWIEVTYTEIPDSTSNCDEFRILADYEYAPLFIYNTTNNERINVRNPNIAFSTKWYKESELIRSTLNPIIFPPIPSEKPIEYKLVVEDEFGCSGEGKVDYHSKVPKAEFIADPMDGEAVLEVTFTNSSINYDSVEWHFYKDSFRYTLELDEAKGEPVDSIDFVLTDDSPIYKFEYTGDYKVKLVTIKINQTGNCYDTLYMAPGAFIKVNVSLIDVPNVFTPNGDGVNDVFKIKSESLKSMNVKIYNRWGGLVHSWKYSNITSKDYTYEHAVWDGRIGNKMASPGVYYYVISYEGRDIYKENLTKEEQKITINRIGKPVKETVTGFVHLFRDKK